MEIKAVFFDIDGTLVNDSRAVLKSTEKAIQSLKEEGIYVGLATGRGPAFVKPFMERYGFDFAVTYNGQYILTKDRVLFTSPIDKKSLHQLIDYAREHRKGNCSRYQGWGIRFSDHEFWDESYFNLVQSLCAPQNGPYSQSWI